MSVYFRLDSLGCLFVCRGAIGESTGGPGVRAPSKTLSPRYQLPILRHARLNHVAVQENGRSGKSRRMDAGLPGRFCRGAGVRASNDPQPAIRFLMRGLLLLRGRANSLIDKGHPKLWPPKDKEKVLGLLSWRSVDELPVGPPDDVLRGKFSPALLRRAYPPSSRDCRVPSDGRSTAAPATDDRQRRMHLFPSRRKSRAQAVGRG